MKLLIVDDHAPTRALIREFVQPLATEIAECADGLDAVAACAESLPDFVIMDLMMPGLDGLAATEHIRRRDPQAAVVIVSQFNSREARENARRVGACGYFVKDDLVDLRRFLAAARHPDSA